MSNEAEFLWYQSQNEPEVLARMSLYIFSAFAGFVDEVD